MPKTLNDPAERLAGRDSAPGGPALLDVQRIARLLACSPRHVYRLTDAGKMPRPVKLGALVRWNRAVVEAWIAEGCPSRTRSARPQTGGAI